MFDFSKVDFCSEVHKPASFQEILDTEKKLGLTIPDIYKEFLLKMNGATTNYALLYSTDELLEMNEVIEIKEYAPGFISIGNDNGDQELLMKAEKNEIEFRLVDQGYMVPDDENDNIFDSFEEWTNNGAEDFFEEDDDDENTGKLILIKAPENGLKELLRIQKEFDICFSMKVLNSGYKNVPCILYYGIKMSKAEEKIKALGDLGKLLKIEINKSN